MQALGISFIIHLIYFLGTWMVGYLKTRNYNPSIANGWTEVEMLQSEVAFGAVASPLFMLSTFFGVALISAFFIFFFGKVVHFKKG
ncbi:quinol-cytochrome oxidoreductase complex cytochrome b subunit [Bacillus tianshenii]|uniref:Quinol-cytochrome oxidoreductase complex cytochrome b subunit n=2 Tax=Sutcliffiella tianshenii TaxID=1463404 RepID=A0ABS2NV45_9BACI|nr:quinol-cytochrome oxidoreductase complex cytochrome b subunit [Bacillus tianshenii]